MTASSYPRLDAYLASLPAGLGSYPRCSQKGSILRTWLAGAPLQAEEADLPPPLRQLITQPPLASAWIPETHANALYLVIADARFKTEADFLSFCRRRNAELFRTPMYRPLVVMGSPNIFFHALRIGWPLMHRGTTLTMVETGPGTATIRLASPAGVIPELVAKAYATSFRAAAEATRLVRECTSELVDFQRETATYHVVWVG